LQSRGGDADTQKHKIKKMRFSSRGGGSKAKSEKTNNTSTSDDAVVAANGGEEENVPLLLKPIIKSKNRAHMFTFFAIIFLIAPAVSLSRVGHPWLLLRVYKMHLKNMEILKETALSWCSMPGCYSNPENFDEEIATNEKKEEGQLLPSFVHVPKAGGTLVESAVGSVGGRVGACNEKRPYEIAPGWDKEVAPWHAQPKKLVKDSFAICRNPFDRFQSQFLYDPRWAKVSNRAEFPHNQKKTCEAFGKWATDKMENWALVDDRLQCYKRTKFDSKGIDACDETFTDDDDESEFFYGEEAKDEEPVTSQNSHDYPQVVLANKVEKLFSFEKCFGNQRGFCPDPRVEGLEKQKYLEETEEALESRKGSFSTSFFRRNFCELLDENKKMQPNLISFLRKRFSDKIELPDVSEENDIASAEVRKCWRNNPYLPAKTIADFLDTYEADFRVFGYPMDIPEVIDKEDEASLGSDESSQDDNEWQASAIKAEYYPKCPPPDEEEEDENENDAAMGRSEQDSSAILFGSNLRKKYSSKGSSESN
jgi:hypothetical protein